MDLAYQSWIAELETRAEENREYTVDAIQAADGYLQKNDLAWLVTYATRKVIKPATTHTMVDNHADWRAYNFVPSDGFKIEFYIPKEKRIEVLDKLATFEWKRTFTIGYASHVYSAFLYETLHQDVMMWDTHGKIEVIFYEPAAEGMELPTGCAVIQTDTTSSLLSIACNTKK